MRVKYFFFLIMLLRASINPAFQIINFLMYSKKYLYPDMKWSLYMVEILSDGLDQENEVTVMTLLRVMDVVPFDKWPFQKRIRLLLCSNGEKRKCDFAKRWTDTIKKGLKAVSIALFSFVRSPVWRIEGEEREPKRMKMCDSWCCQSCEIIRFAVEVCVCLLQSTLSWIFCLYLRVDW